MWVEGGGAEGGGGRGGGGGGGGGQVNLSNDCFRFKKKEDGETTIV